MPQDGSGLSRDSSWCGASLATLPGLPKVVKDWAGALDGHPVIPANVPIVPNWTLVL